MIEIKNVSQSYIKGKNVIENMNLKIEDFKNEWHEIVSIYRFIIKEENDDE